MYQYILFDLDGTLTDPKEGITKSVQYALEHFGIEEDTENLLKFIGPPLKQSFMEYYDFDEEKAKLAIVKYRERFSTIGLFENGVYEGIEVLLMRLKESGKILAVATSKPELFAKQIVKHYGLEHYFDVIVGSELDGTRSKKAEVIEEVFRQLEITEENKLHTIMIGDREHDVIGAKTCEIVSIGVKFGYAEEGELRLAGADYVVDTVDELGRLLEQI